MRKWLIQKSSLILLMTLPNLTIALEGNARPNILLIIVDDLAAVTERVATPSIDRIASEGITFTNHFANVPVCGASRASLMSGLAPSSRRFLTYDSRLDEDAPEVPTMPSWLKQHGYHTVARGKVFDVTADSRDSWSEAVWNPEGSWHGPGTVDGRESHLQKAYLSPVEGPRLPATEQADVDDHAYPDGQIALQAADDIRRLATAADPFFLAVGFRKPHLPFTAPSRYWNNESTNTPDTESNLPDRARHRSLELRNQYDAMPLIGDLDAATADHLRAAYFAAVRYIDAQIGIVLDALAASGADDNTIIAITGDHGFLLGEHGMWTKHALLEPALRTPLIISAPGSAAATSQPVITDLLDLYPTLVELAGLKPPAHLEGVSLTPVIRDPSLARRASKPVSISRWLNGQSARNERYRYTRWQNEAGETLDHMLFDLALDPGETRNIVADPKAASVVMTLSRTLNQDAGNTTWSEELKRMVSLMDQLNSPYAEYMVAATLYPLRAGLLLLLLVALLAGTWLVIAKTKRPANGREPTQ